MLLQKGRYISLSLEFYIIIKVIFVLFGSQERQGHLFTGNILNVANLQESRGQKIHPFTLLILLCLPPPSPSISLSLFSFFSSLMLARWLCNQPSQRWPFCFCLPYLLFAVSLSVITLLLAFHPGAKTQHTHWPYSLSSAPKRLLCKITHSPPTHHLSLSLKHTHINMFKTLTYAYIMCTHPHVLSSDQNHTKHGCFHFA